MPKMRRKADLPSKPCGRCGLPMAYRKAWARSWDQVVYCSDRCRDEAKAERRSAARPGADPGRTVEPDGSR